MQVTDELIRSVVQEVLAHVRNGQGAPAPHRGNGQAPLTPTPSVGAASRAAPVRLGSPDLRRERGRGEGGVYQDVDAAIKAAVEAQRAFEARGLEDRRKAVECVRKICKEQAETLGREELEATKIGRLP